MTPAEEKLAQNTLQRFEAELPLQRLFYPEFWPLTSNHIYLTESRRVVIHAAESFECNDFYNSFFLNTWSVSISEVALRLSYSSFGGIFLEIWHEAPAGTRQRVHHLMMAACEDGRVKDEMILLPDRFENVCLGHLFFRVTALETSCTISDCGWYPLRSPRRTPRIALVITHFRREAQVQAFLASIQGTVVAEMVAQARLAVVIIDNSQTLPAPSLAGVHVIPNANYGGSGGFARGMLEAESLGCSHCLLLDDDASLGDEGILRIWNRHAMAEDDTAIASIQLQAERPDLIIDAAACYDGTCKGIAHGYSILDFNSLKWIWNTPPNADFGAWCGFSFPLSGLRYYPFPFFVRGDDVLMPMLNKMCIRTINGVTSLAPRFERKKGPLQAILDTRCELLIRSAVLHMNPLKAAAYYAKPYLNDLVSYRYGHCLGMHEGLRMYANAETAFTSDLDGAKAREAARPLNQYWQYSPLAPDWRTQEGQQVWHTKLPDRPTLDWFRKLLFALTLNGHLIPFTRLLQRHVFVSDLEMRISYKDALFASQIVYFDHLCINRQGDQSRVCRFDRRVSLLCLLYLCTDVVCILLQGNAWSRHAARIARKLSTADFWKGVYGL
jgi:hypothetical protein